MSGGHFDYDEDMLRGMAGQLERDIEYNDVKFTFEQAPKYGFQHDKETIAYMRLMAGDLRVLRDLLHLYDYAVSGDSDIKEFKKLAKRVYGEKAAR